MTLLTGKAGNYATRRLTKRLAFVGSALGLWDRGFFTPYRHSRDIRAPAGPYPAVAARFEARRPAFRAAIDRLAAHEDRLLAAETGAHPVSWSSNWLPRLDGAMIYAMVADARPARAIEVGSGNSTRFIARAIADQGIACAVTCIDPQPRASIADLPVGFVRSVLTEELAERTWELGPGDLLFVDSSHILQEGSDIDIIFNRIFPLLAPGVLVHVHDVYLPYVYPARARQNHWNEQNALVGWIVSDWFEVLFPCHYAARHLAAEIAGACPRLFREGTIGGGSLWLRKT